MNPIYFKNFLLLKHKVKNKTRKTEKIRKNKNYITRSEKNSLGIGKIHRNSFRYTDLIPLNDLWKKYFRDFLELDRYEKNKIPTPLDKNWDYFSTLLIKADYHGAIFTVIRSTCPSLVGHTGICVMETQNTLYIVDQKNITRNIPKQPTVFQVQIDEIKLIIFGKYMKIRPAERSTKKIKNYIKPDL
ncbi:ribonuclease P protein subunit p29 [Chrysoperla carnea]|uniref:ribonuclease P protein subunit p29 n=1 Tax=Chrysoperla carnea TaxID=189513 RepID=UPI001D06423E|nr:ribonuclease P protein subunit p29 [Chrysoperla carnea]